MLQKKTWFAANIIIWKLTHWLLPYLVHSIGLSCGEDSDRFFFKIIRLLQYSIVILFAAFCILQQVENFCERNLENQFRMPNKPCIPSLEVIIAIFLNLYNLLQKILFCSILHQTIIFWERNHSESIQNAKLALYIKFGSDCCNTLEVIPFAANDTILQHFAATWWFL